MGDVKVSVIVPVYNVEKYLDKCMESIVNQSFNDMEIICINDASPDNSQLILEKYAKMDKRIILMINEENLGLGRTRNKAMKFVKGEYVVFVDSDDWLELTLIEDLYNAITNSQANIAFSNFQNVHQDSGKIKIVNLNSRLVSYGVKLEDNKTFTNKDIKRVCFRKIPNFAWGRMYRVDFLKHNNIEFASYKYEDQIFSIKAKLLSEKNVYVDKVLYNYRIQEESIMRTSKVPFFNIFNDITNLLKDLGLEKVLKNEYAEYIMENVVLTIKKLSIKEKIVFYKEAKDLLPKELMRGVDKKMIRYLLKDIFLRPKKKQYK